MFVGCPEVKNGYMLAQEKPGLGIEVDEKVAAKFPIPAGPPNFDYSVGHDAAVGRDGDQTLNDCGLRIGDCGLLIRRPDLTTRPSFQETSLA